MAALNLSEVSKQFKVNRSTIYRAVSSGRLSRRADGSFDLAEVIRCFGEPKNIQSKLDDLPNPSAVKDTILTDELDRLRQDFSEYRRKAEEREDWLKSQLDRMQTLLEMKSSVVADATLQQQMHEPQSNTTSATPQTIANTDSATNEALYAAPQQHSSASLRNTADATVQHTEKKRGLFGRLVKAVLAD